MPKRFWRVAMLAGAIAACDWPGTGPLAENRSISVDVGSLSLFRGESQQVIVSLSPDGPPVTLSAEGMPEGLTASFSPGTVASGETRSVLTILAGPPAEGTLTIRASSKNGASGLTTQSTAKVTVRVTECPGYALPDRCPPFPTGGDFSITGVVMERTAEGVRPAENRSVYAWVQRATTGYSAGSVKSGAGGAYTFGLLPRSLVVLQAGGGDWDQPCATVVQLDGNGQTANLEVVSDKRPIFDPAPAAPGLFGVVHERTPEGRRPVAGVKNFVEMLFEIVAATTTTDEQGRYSLCRLPTSETFVTPVKSGYVMTYRPVWVSGVMQMDLEMVRE